MRRDATRVRSEAPDREDGSLLCDGRVRVPITRAIVVMNEGELCISVRVMPKSERDDSGTNIG